MFKSIDRSLGYYPLRSVISVRESEIIFTFQEMILAHRMTGRVRGGMTVLPHIQVIKFSLHVNGCSVTVCLAMPLW